MARRRAPVQLDVAELAPLLHELMPVGGGEQPAEVLGYLDAPGRWRRMVATYPNGWKVTVRLNAKLEVTSVASSIRLVSEKRARA